MDKASLFAVVVDISEPFKIEDNCYTTKIKIIDSSFNYTKTSDNEDVKFNRYAMIYVYSEKIVECPAIKHIGDIIRLRRFQFRINHLGELEGKSKSFSNWLVYNS